MDWLIDWLYERLFSWLIVLFVYLLNDWPVGWLIDDSWPVDWPPWFCCLNSNWLMTASWLAGWLTGALAVISRRRYSCCDWSTCMPPTANRSIWNSWRWFETGDNQREGVEAGRKNWFWGLRICVQGRQGFPPPPSSRALWKIINSRILLLEKLLLRYNIDSNIKTLTITSWP